MEGTEQQNFLRMVSVLGEVEEVLTKHGGSIFLDEITFAPNSYNSPCAKVTIYLLDEKLRQELRHADRKHNAQ